MTSKFSYISFHNFVSNSLDFTLVRHQMILKELKENQRMFLITELSRSSLKFNVNKPKFLSP